MSKGELIRFIGFLQDDDGAKAKVMDMGTDFEAIASFVQGSGFTLSVSDFSAANELSEEELKAIAGGGSGFTESSVGGFIAW